MMRNYGLILLSVVLLMLGIGLQNTLIGVRAGLEGFSTAAVGAVMTAYFLGFIAGSLNGPTLIDRVGHIRAFSVFATLASSAAILHALHVEPFFWALLRAVTGYCIAGIYMVIESWLNGRSDNAGRGGLLSAYFFANLFAIALGQQLLVLDDPLGFELFVYSSVLASLAIVPVAMTRTDAPAPVRSTSLPLLTLYAISPFALIGSATSGLATGAFWGLAPLYGVELALSNEAIALGMTAAVIGGALSQLPLGRLSDVIDRRIITAAASMCLAILCAALAVFGSPTEAPALGVALAAVLGSLLLTQYPLVVAHANDYAADGDFVRLASALLLVYGVGAAAGPVTAAVMMDLAGPGALFHFIAGCGLFTAAYAAWRMTRRTALTAEESGEFQPLLATTVLAPTGEAAEGIDSDAEIQFVDPTAPAEEERDQDAPAAAPS